MNLNCVLGKDHLLDRLETGFKKAKSVDIIVSFLMESGVKLLRDDILELVDKGVPVRILTGNYMNITEPQALYLLKDMLGESLDLRFYSEKRRSFHPKAYIFRYEDDSELFIGSSNMSCSALTGGIEWNYRIVKSKSPNDFDCFVSEFEDLFHNESIIVDDIELRNYAKSWKKPKIVQSEYTYDKVDDEKVLKLYEPRGAQIEALYELKNSRQEGFDKGLVVAATGVGKTYLAAFDSQNYEKVLFVAHREEILKQAMNSFRNIRSDKKMGYFCGNQKQTDVDMVFATVQTLGKEKYLNGDFFPRDYFDYIVVDEFHHSVASNYQNIIEYFSPKYMLGLTATPDRLDNKDVFSVCDYNLVYEIRLKEAIDRGLLVPFRYYGIFDESVDYGKIDMSRGRYNERQLEESLMINRRSDMILNHYRKYRSKGAIGFCSSRNHAEHMAEYFNKEGVKSAAVLSDSKSVYSLDRGEAIGKLKSGEIKVIFSVDIFNEGVDIPSLDMLLFLRPTESPTVFLQQLGRGLRRHKNKKYVNVLDFIGNFKRANFLPILLTGKTEKSESVKFRDIEEEDYPEDCIVDFDFRVVDLFERMERESLKLDEIIRAEYYRIKEEIGHKPSRVELFTYMDDAVYLKMKSKSKLNILNDYLGFLNGIGELDKSEQELVGSYAHDFLKMLENTKMTRLYKMPLILSFYKPGKLKLKVSDDEIEESFREFYKSGSNKADIARDRNKSKYSEMAKQPKEAFTKTHGEFFYRDGSEYCISEKLSDWSENDVFLDCFKDIVEYRAKRFYKERLET